MAYKKKIKRAEAKEEAKLTTAELIEVGAFSQRLGMVLAGLENEKKQAAQVREDAEFVYTIKTADLDAKIALITENPVKYFRILDTQSGLLGGSAASKSKAAVGVSKPLTEANVTDNGNLTLEKLNKILAEVDSVYRQGRDIGNMIYHNSHPGNRAYHQRY